MAEVKAGVETSEFKAAKSVSAWGTVATVLGIILTFGSAVLPALGGGAGIIIGAVIVVAGIVQKTLAELGYIKSRTEVKVAASLEATE